MENTSRHRASYMNVVAGYVLAILVTSAGTVLLATLIRTMWSANFQLPWDADRGWSWMAIIFGFLLEFLLLLTAGMTWYYATLLLFREITIQESGLTICDSYGVREIAWRDIRLITIVDLSELIPILHYPFNLILPRWHSKKYEIWVNGDVEPFTVDKTTVGDLPRFVNALCDGCQRFGIPITHRIEEPAGLPGLD
jgi:hypothetical protein